MSEIRLPSLMEQINALEPAMLRIFRDSEADIGYREALIYVDGELVAEVDYKSFVELYLPPGEHTIQAYNRVFRSKKLRIELQPGERVTMQTGNVGGGCFLLSMILTMGAPKVFLKVDAPETTADGRLEGVRKLGP